MTRQERQAQSAANKLVKALEAIESYDGDPTDVLEDAKIQVNSLQKKTTYVQMIGRLEEYYAEERT